MRTQPRLLQFFSECAQEKRPVAARDVARELRITDQAAVGTLEVLWRHRLITPPPSRPPGFKWRPAPGERVQDLSFQLTPRGRERLEWWAQRDRREGGNPWPF